jgi:hypothetical protein
MKHEFEYQYELISRGAVEMLPEQEFKERLKKSIDEDKPLRVKQGFDPTAPDIHISNNFLKYSMNQKPRFITMAIGFPKCLLKIFWNWRLNSRSPACWKEMILISDIKRAIRYQYMNYIIP